MKHFDVIGIGVGPANLSLAALMENTTKVSSCFFERKNDFSWHPGMLFPFSCINVGHHKDLVSLVDPKNPYSFANYLIIHNKIYDFFNAGFDRVPRCEFESYYHWVANSLSSVRFNTTVLEVNYEVSQDRFKIITNEATYTSKHLVMGAGIEPKFPTWFNERLVNDSVFHGYHYLAQPRCFKNQTVLIVGGGQSAAEILAQLLESESQLPRKVYWASTKGYPAALDENPFANEVYTPNYSQYFYSLDLAHREQLNMILRETSDGIHNGLLQKIYQRLFELKHIKKTPVKLNFLPMSRVEGLVISSNEAARKKYQADIKGCIDTSLGDLDAVIFCTGHKIMASRMMSQLGHYCLSPLKVDYNFSIQTNYPRSTCKLFLNNGAKKSHGSADPNLSLMAWRSACIINALLDEDYFLLSSPSSILDWGLDAEAVNKTASDQVKKDYVYDEY